MREILFRGKLKNDINPYKPAGSWVYGGYYFGKHGACIHEKESATGLFVDPKTVVQYTGISDENGVKIFEGDIVKDNGGYIGTVEFLEGMFLVDVGWENDLVTIEWEVIGNIHDNPELPEADDSACGETNA